MSAVWQMSAFGRILHLVDQQGLALCGRQFDPQTLRTPNATPNAETMPYCSKCFQAHTQLAPLNQVARLLESEPDHA